MTRHPRGEMDEIPDGCELAGFELGWAKRNLERVLSEPAEPSPELRKAAEEALKRIAIRKGPAA